MNTRNKQRVRPLTLDGVVAPKLRTRKMASSTQSMAHKVIKNITRITWAEALGGLTLTVGICIFMFPRTPSTYMSVLHMASLAVHFGTQVWVTFFSAVVLIFNLPRRQFGEIQGKLFNKYYMLGTILSCLKVITFLYNQPSQVWGFAEEMQLGLLVSCALCEIVSAAYVTRRITKLMEQCHKIEKDNNIEDDMKRDTVMLLREMNPSYDKAYNQFMDMHALGSLLNLISIISNVTHLYYTASYLVKLQ